MYSTGNKGPILFGQLGFSKTHYLWCFSFVRSNSSGSLYCILSALVYVNLMCFTFLPLLLIYPSHLAFQMADFDFVIPLSLRALEDATSNNQYVVTNVLTAWEVKSKMKGKYSSRNVKCMMSHMRQLRPACSECWSLICRDCSVELWHISKPKFVIMRSVIVRFLCKIASLSHRNFFCIFLVQVV